jgi:hypothetical protein
MTRSLRRALLRTLNQRVQGSSPCAPTSTMKNLARISGMMIPCCVATMSPRGGNSFVDLFER